MWNTFVIPFYFWCLQSVASQAVAGSPSSLYICPRRRLTGGNKGTSWKFIFCLGCSFTGSKLTPWPLQEAFDKWPLTKFSVYFEKSLGCATAVTRERWATLYSTQMHHDVALQTISSRKRLAAHMAGEPTRVEVDALVPHEVDPALKRQTASLAKERWKLLAHRC